MEIRDISEGRVFGCVFGWEVRGLCVGASFYCVDERRENG